MGARTRLLLEMVDQAFRAPSWHGTPLLGTLRGLSWRDALRRPGRGRHNVWELVLHTAYWKYIVRRRLTRDEDLEFPRTGSNWLALPPQPDAAQWRRDLALLKEQHRLLRQTIARFPESQLPRRAWRSRWSNVANIYGIASHDLYHAGQIQLVKRMIGR